MSGSARRPEKGGPIAAVSLTAHRRRNLAIRRQIYHFSSHILGLDSNILDEKMLRKAMDVLELFGPTRSQLGVLEAAELLGRPKSTMSRWLSAMEAAGFLERDVASQRYHLSIRLATLGQLARAATPLQRLARPILRELTDRTGETSDLVILTGADAINVEAVESPRPIKHVGWVGRHIPLHATAAGKCLLAWQPEDRRRELVHPPLKAFTGGTITSVGLLREELARIRAQGYSASMGEFEPDLVGLASPVRDHTGMVVAVITIGAPIGRVPPEALPELTQRVVAAAGALSSAAGYAVPA